MGNIAEQYKNSTIPYEELEIGMLLKITEVNEKLKDTKTLSDLVNEIVQITRMEQCAAVPNNIQCKACITNGKTFNFKTVRDIYSCEYFRNNCYYKFNSLDGRRVSYE
jgi:hypothetical protein